MRIHELHGPDAVETHEAWRHRIATTLLRASALLTRLAISVQQVRRRRHPVLEFYAEAGAPEGALYVDGHLAGTLLGVKRL